MKSPAHSTKDERPARERILATAHDLFYRDGIRATGVDRVIGEAGVTKVTFYRHFPSKDDLVRAFLDHRHERWMRWFTEALARHRARSPGLAALVPALAEWLRDEGYRGCAFINSVVEVGASVDDAAAIAQRHKDDMTAAIADLLPPSRGRAALAQMAAMAVDGAIVRAQMDASPDRALRTLRDLVRAIEADV